MTEIPHNCGGLETDLDPAVAAVELRGADIGSLGSVQHVVVSGVNWKICIGQFWLISGSSGSGKSRLLETVAGLMPPVRGVHLLFGQLLHKLPAEAAAALRRRIGLVFPDGGRLFPSLTVAQNISLPICYHRECGFEGAIPRVEQLLSATGLIQYANWSPMRLNRSFRQRAALARALTLEPEVLLLDNPLSGVDVGHVEWWVEFIGALLQGHPLLGGKKMAIVVATDDVRPWQGVANRFAMIINNQWNLLDSL